jgi:TRAP-type mannitol/chloroaromatic compound transport system permease large subunit
MGLDPVWLGVMMAMNLQTSFLTPPFGFALFYLRGVAPENVATGSIYKGALPFVGLQIGMLGLVALFPQLATALPDALGR